MKYDCIVLVTDDFKKPLDYRHIPVKRARYEYQYGKVKEISVKIRGKHRSWIVPGQSKPNIMIEGLPAYVVCEENIYPLGYFPHKTKWDTETLNGVLKKAVVKKGVDKMGRPMEMKINWKLLIIIGVGLVIGYFIMKSFTGNQGSGEETAIMDYLQAVM